MEKDAFLVTMKLEPADEDYRAWTLDYLVEDGVVLHFRIVQQMPDFADTWFTAYVDPYDAKEADDRFTVSYPDPEDSWARYAELFFLGRRFEPHGGYTASLGWDYAHCGDEEIGWTAEKVAEDIWTSVSEWLGDWTPRGQRSPAKPGKRRSRRRRTLHSYGLDLVDVLFAKLGRALGRSEFNQVSHEITDVCLWKTGSGDRYGDPCCYEPDRILAHILPAGADLASVLVQLPLGDEAAVRLDDLVALLQKSPVFDDDMKSLVEAGVKREGGD